MIMLHLLIDGPQENCESSLKKVLAFEDLEMSEK